MKHYQKVSKKAESQARKLKRLLSIDQDEIEMAENSTDSDNQEGEEEDEEEEDEDDGGDDDDDSSVNDDELNSSDIYPIEMKFHFDEDEDQVDKDIDYLEVRNKKATRY